jgi:hypothetical protein
MTLDFEEQVRRGLRAASQIHVVRGDMDFLEQRMRRRGRRRLGLRITAVVAVVAVVLISFGLLRGGQDDRTIFASGPLTRPPAGTEGWWSIAEAPVAARFQHTAVWTGTEMVVWGGYGAHGGHLFDGAAYNPKSNAWRRIPRAPLDLESDQSSGVALWMDTQMLVVAGYDHAKAAAYDPATDEWRKLPDPPFFGVASSGTYAAWTGTEALLWGEFGRTGEGSRGGGRREIAIYDPGTNRWRLGARAPIDAPIFSDVVWTGTELVSVSGTLRPVAYDPTADRWRVLPPAPLDERSNPLVVWTGTELVVGGGDDREGSRRDAAAYAPSTSTWRRLPDAPLPFAGSGRYGEVWSGHEALAFEAQGSLGLEGEGRVIALDPNAGTWRVGLAPTIPRRDDLPLIWTGDELILWGGGQHKSEGKGTSGCCDPIPIGEAYVPPA